MRANSVIVLAALLVVTPAIPLVGAQAPSHAWARTDFTVTSFDGTALAASAWVPNAATPVPAILITNGWNSRHDTGTELRLSERYADQGYVVLGWTSRGWGNSGGEIELDGPKEQNDTRTMIDLLATNKDKWHVQMEPTGPCINHDGQSQLRMCPDLSTTDPRVGMVGESYGGGIQLLTAQGDARIDSIIPRIAWNNLLTSLAPHDVLKAGWITEFYGTGQTVSRGVPVPGTHPGDNPDQGGPSQDLTTWYTESAAMNGPTADMRTQIGWVRSVHPGKLTTPTMLIQGWGDTLFQPEQALATFADLRGRTVPARLIFYPGGHGQTLADDDPASTFVDRQMDDWLNVTLRGRAPTLPPYPVLRYRDAEKDYVGELQWPPAGTTMWRGYLGASGNDGLKADKPTATATTMMVNPTYPATCVDVPHFQSEAGTNCPYTTPGTSAIWSGPVLAADQEVTGAPMAHLIVTSTQPSDVRFFLTLEDVDAGGNAMPVWRQAMPMRTGAASNLAVDVAMQATTHTFPKGHRISVQIASTDLSFDESREGGAITISSSATAPSWVDIPMVPKDKWGDHKPPTVGFNGESAIFEDAFGIANVSFVPQPTRVQELACLPDGIELACHDYGRLGTTKRVFEVQVGNLTTVEIRATDFAGNQVLKIWHAAVPATQGPECDVPAAGCLSTSSKGTPWPEAVLPVALVFAALASRRRLL